MKKILSILLTAAMLLSLAIVAVVPAAAIEGDWDTYEEAGQYLGLTGTDERSIGGYEYTDDGFHVTPADWSTSTPFTTAQRKDTVDLKQGVYMEVRIDNYSYDAGDRWFNFSIWDSVRLHPGVPNEAYGEGLQTLIRPAALKEGETIGKIGSVAWYIEGFTGASSTTFPEGTVTTTEDGKNFLTLEVKWDEAKSTYSVKVNGAEASKKAIDYMNTKYGTNSQAYIGFSVHNNQLGGTAEFTITSWGTSIEDATIPTGDDTKLPDNKDNTKAPIADASTVEVGKPAIVMTGNQAESDMKAYQTNSGATLTVTDDYAIHVVAGANIADTAMYVKNDISYDIKDFPVVLAITRNYCTCGLGGECIAIENLVFRPYCGEVVAADDKHMVRCEEQISYDPYIIGEDKYLAFAMNLTDPDYVNFDVEGRIHGVRIDSVSLDLNSEGGNAYDVCMIAYFRTVDEAVAYAEQYFTDLGWDPDGGEEATTEENQGGEATTEENQGGEATTEDNQGGEATTEDNQGGEATTEENQGGEATTEDNQGGCGSVVGLGAVAIVAMVAGVAMISFKKKED